MGFGTISPTALQNVPDSSVMNAMQDPQLPGESPVAIDEWQRRQRMRAAQPAPANTNPMGAQPMGGIAQAPMSPPTAMKSGGIVPHEVPKSDAELRKLLHGEIKRRMAEGGIVHNRKGGLQQLLALASGQGLEGMNPEDILKMKAEEEARQALVDQIPADVPPAARALAASTPAADNTGDPYWDDPAARQNPATWMADRAVAQQKAAANAPAPAAAGIASVGRISPADIAAGTAEQAAALKDPRYASFATLGTPVNSDERVREGWRGGPMPADQRALMMSDIARSKGAPAGAGSTYAPGAAAAQEAVAVPATQAMPESKRQTIQELMDSLKGDGKQSAKMQEKIDALKADKGMDSMSSGILAAMANAAMGGPNRFGRTLAGGIGGYQAAEAAQRKDQHAITAEELKMLQGDISEENLNKRTAATLYSADTQADRATKQAIAAQYAADARERTGMYRADRALEAAGMRANGVNQEDKFAQQLKIEQFKASMAALKANPMYQMYLTSDPSKAKQMEDAVVAAAQNMTPGGSGGAPAARAPIPYKYTPDK